MEHIKIPVRVLEERLSPGAKVLFGYLFTVSDDRGGVVGESQGDMARACGMTRGAASRALSELVGAGHLKMTRLPSDYLERKPFRYVVECPDVPAPFVPTPDIQTNGAIPYRDIVAAYNGAASVNGMAQAKKLTQKRKGAVKRLYQTLNKNMDTIAQYFGWLSESDFYGGVNDRGWKADFDYVCEERVILRYMEKGEHTKPSAFTDTRVEKERLAKVFDDARRQVQNLTSRSAANDKHPKDDLQVFWRTLSDFLIRESAMSILPQLKTYVSEYWGSIDGP
tara:strand:- start:4593 stop:5432 length:840 start_codon:yes stop_codon:yes gene_type:complete